MRKELYLSLSIPLLTLTPTGHIKTLNEAACDMLEETREYLISKDFTLLACGDNSEAKELSKVFNSLVRQESGVSKTVELPVIDNLYSMHILSRPDAKGDRELHLRLVRLHDEKDKLKRQLKKAYVARKDLERKLQAKKSLPEQVILSTLSMRKLLVSYLFCGIIFFTILGVVIDLTLPPENTKSDKLYQLVSTLTGSFTSILLYYYASSNEHTHDAGEDD